VLPSTTTVVPDAYGPDAFGLTIDQVAPWVTASAGKIVICIDGVCAASPMFVATKSTMRKTRKTTAAAKTLNLFLFLLFIVRSPPLLQF
jgi:hypothetical protein